MFTLSLEGPRPSFSHWEKWNDLHRIPPNENGFVIRRLARRAVGAITKSATKDRMQPARRFRSLAVPSPLSEGRRTRHLSSRSRSRGFCGNGAEGSASPLAVIFARHSFTPSFEGPLATSVRPLGHNTGRSKPKLRTLKTAALRHPKACFGTKPRPPTLLTERPPHPPLSFRAKLADFFLPRSSLANASACVVEESLFSAFARHSPLLPNRRGKHPVCPWLPKFTSMRSVSIMVRYRHNMSQ